MLEFDRGDGFMLQVFTVLSPMFAVGMVVILAKRTASHTFRCGHCSREFKIKWSKAVVAEHSDNEYMLVCPHCKTKGWCTEQLKK